MTEDPLHVYSPILCPVCGGGKRARKTCEACRRTGFVPIDLSGLWRGYPAFLVCGGPSLDTLDLDRLEDRGIASLGVNNAAGYVRTRAFVCGDPHVKFHHGIWLDPSMLCFVPDAKLRYHLRAKLPDGTFRPTDIRVMDCPSVFGFGRTGRRPHGFEPEKFLDTPYAHWGIGKHPQWKLDTMLLGLRLLHYLGCPRVYLLGVDLDRPSKERGYAWDERGSGGMRKYEKLNNMLRTLRPAFDARGWEVWNCNPDSKCDAFGHVAFDAALEDCRGAVPREPFDLTGWYAQEGKKTTGVPVSREELVKIERRGGGYKGKDGRVTVSPLVP